MVPWVPLTKDCTSHRSSAGSSLATPFYQNLSAAKAASMLVISLHVLEMWISDDSLHPPSLLDRPRPASLLAGNNTGCSVWGRWHISSRSAVLEESQGRVLLLPYVAVLGGKFATRLQSPAAGCTKLPAASSTTVTLVLSAACPPGKALHLSVTLFFTTANRQ